MLITGPVVLVWQSSGCPMEVTLTVIVPGKKLAEIQGVGPGPAGGGTTMAHPLTIKGADDTGTGVPIINTRGLGVVGAACPPWTQVTEQAMVNKNPGIRSPPKRRR
jgi:hypothetical protein